MTFNETPELPIRIQITCYSKLVAEVIVHQSMQDKTWAAYARNKYDKQLPIGSCVMQRADLPRMWNVLIGLDILD